MPQHADFMGIEETACSLMAAQFAIVYWRKAKVNSAVPADTAMYCFPFESITHGRAIDLAAQRRLP